jgi:hypothetical protein
MSLREGKQIYWALDCPSFLFEGNFQTTGTGGGMQRTIVSPGIAEGDHHWKGKEVQIVKICETE